jgi:hypothetical protein
MCLRLSELSPIQIAIRSIVVLPSSCDCWFRSDTYKVTAAQISTMDLQIGRIYNALQDASLLDNCIIGFSS